MRKQIITSVAAVAALASVGWAAERGLPVQEPQQQQQRPAQQTTPTTMPETSSDRTGQIASGPAAFVNEMTAAGLAEITLGELASKHASTDEVKAFGQMMVKDHTQANTDLAQIASRLQITPSAQL